MTGFETARGRVELRELQTLEDMRAAEEIQLKVWGAEITPTPKDLLIPIQHEGGFLAGAFAENGAMIGLVFSFPTRDPAIQHSHMLATLEEWRGHGIGTRLKWYQRDWGLQHGVEQIRWTVDPLRAANAELNIRHLGGTSSCYWPNYYGEMQGIDAGLPSDRLLVEWHLSSPRVAQRAGQAPRDAGFPEAVPANQVDEQGCPVCLPVPCDSPAVLIHLPKNFIELSKTAPPLALAWRMQTRTLFMDYFTRGYVIAEFTRVGGPAYLLRRQKLIE